ncbi:non-ribosomal peptide synthetase [Pseudoalteromonas sp. Of11M-6]|uniref:non-ribosomal peptide synthetase n=1 Tax=Pseudoalteromonas sp. Of11M-6 TaxID=2917754 RepID=UPI001EF4A30A|nr:non-ribosomal peptide synthetase [Pseudoalteromonas sp. Of11M-6]MCG7556188.1 amino acid adenylation domain-containing protein [Pseudoalteromonas sp. Of11M-6]
MVQKIIKKALAAGIELYLEEQKLKFTAPKGALTSELKNEISAHKDDIIQYLQHSIQRPKVSAITPRPDSKYLPLSLAQARLWFIHQLGGGESSEYNIFAAFELEGELRVDKVSQALAEIINRHEVLRCGYVEQQNQTLQFLHQDFEIPLFQEDYSLLSAAEYETKLQQLITKESRYSFDLSAELVLRVTLVKRHAKQHCLLFAVHHIAADGWSVEVLSSEFVTSYHQLATGQSVQLTALPIQYADYAYWQKQHLDQPVLEQKLEFWHDYLAEAPEVHSLPLDRPRPKQQNFTSKQMQVPLSKKLSEQLVKLAKSHNVTLFTLLQSAFAFVLGRFSGSDDIVMATPVAGREREEVQSLIGCFLNTIVLRSEIPEDGDFWQFLAKNKSRVQQAFGHQEVPFDQVVEAVQPSRNLAYNPLAQIKFVLQNYQQSQFELTDLIVRALPLREGAVRYDLDLSIFEEQGSLILDWNYKSELFDQVTVERLSTAMVQLLTALPEHQSNQSLPSLLSEETRQSLLSMGTGEQQVTDTELPIVQQILIQAQSAPERIAARAGDTTLSYGELIAKAKNLAGCLSEQEIGHGDHVALLLPKSVELLVAVIGVQLAGAVYIPLDKSSGKTRLEYVLKDVDAELLITQSALLETVSSEGYDVMLMDDCLTPDWLSEFTPSSLPPTQLSDSAYLIYTSGSTGQPKGVEITQLGLQQYCAFASDFYYQDHLVGSLLVTEPAFDISVPSLYLPLLHGGCVTLLPQDDVIFALLNELQQLELEGVLLRLTPSHCQALLDALKGQVITAPCVLVIGGEALSQRVALALSDTFPNSLLYNHYGPTETVVGCCIHAFNDLPLSGNGTVPIGLPMTNTQLLVLNEQQQLQVPGGIGELWIAGTGVAKGYWQRPELTSRCFVVDVLKSGSSERYYKTGDLVRWNSQGRLEFIGRNDQQVKIRGHRVELGEIETLLEGCDGVQRLIAHVNRSQENEYLVCYFVPQHEDVEAVRNQLEGLAAARLPMYMRPHCYIALDDFPLSRNGKVNRRALPDPKTLQQTSRLAPESLVEMQLLDICTQLLSRTDIAPNSDFFAMGGHSLLAVRLINHVSTQLGKKLQLKDIFNHPIIRDLAKFIQKSEDLALEPIKRLETDMVKPLSVAQQRLWLLSQIESNQAQYNMPFALDICGQFDVDIAEYALTQLLERHQALLMNFVTIDAQPQLQLTQEAFQLVLLDVTGKSIAEQQCQLETVRLENATIPFDLSRDCLLRGTYVKRGEQHGTLLLTTHHIATDAWSMNILLRDFITIYKQKLGVDTEALPVIDIQYSDYAAWHHEQLASNEHKAHLDYWLTQLADIDAVHQLPIYQARSNQQTFAGNNLQWLLNQKQLNGLKQLAGKHNATLFMVLHGLLSLLICRHTQHSQVVIGTPVANRSHPQLDNVVGFFINNLVLKVECSLKQSFGTFLEQIKQVNLEALSRQATPFEQLVEMLAPERSLNYSPLFQIMLILDNTANEALPLGDLPFSMTPQLHSESVAKYELTWHAREQSEGLQLTVEYRTELFHQQYIEQMMAQFAQLVDGVIDSEQQACYHYNLLPESQRDYLLQQLNCTSQAFDSEGLLQHAIEYQSVTQPDKVAVCFNNENLTFAELNAQSECVAKQLCQRGIRPGDLVGICQPRSLSMLINMLAILKVGGAYLPLDPSYPPQRLNYIVQDSELKHLILTQSLQPLFSNNVSAALHLLEYLDLQASTNPVSYTNQLTSDSLAYVIYTSGSTGKPKGVKVSHRNVLNFFTAMSTSLPSNSSDITWLASTSISFDISVLELFWSLASGAKVIIQPERPQSIASEKLAQVHLCKSDMALLDAKELSVAKFSSYVGDRVSCLHSDTENLGLNCRATEQEYEQAARSGAGLSVLYQGSELSELATKVAAFNTIQQAASSRVLYLPVSECNEQTGALCTLEDSDMALAQLALFGKMGFNAVVVIYTSQQHASITPQQLSCVATIQERFIQHDCQTNMLAQRFENDWDPAQLIVQHQVSHFQATPSYIRELLHSDSGRDALQQLELLLVGGEALSDDLAQQLCALLPERVFNMYGPTECTVWSCAAKVKPQAVTIGAPVANTQVYVVDEFQQLMPHGAVGELLIAGEGVTPGYLNRPELTQQRFVEVSFLTTPIRAYKTGDLVRWQDTGELIYVGRNDDQVKIKGHRIELGEVERLIREFADCQQVAVVKQCRSQTGLLVAFVVCSSTCKDKQQSVSQWRHILAMRAPSYLIPDRIECVSALPLTPNGKVDKSALANLNVVADIDFVPAKSESEHSVMESWQQILGLNSDISVHDSFFNIGGHSLLSLRLVNELNAKFNSTLSLRDIFEHNTIAALSRLIDEKQTSQQHVIPRRKKSQQSLPLSLQQRRLWFIDQLHDGKSTHYNMHLLFQVGKQFNLALATQVMNELIERHQALRTIYRTQEEEITQVVVSRPKFTITELNEQQLCAQSAVDERLKALAQLPFELATSIPFRATYVTTGLSCYLLICVHHIATDAWSMEVLAQEFYSLYQAYQQGKAHQLVAPTVDYADYALWQHSEAQQQRLARQNQYWLEQLSDMPMLSSLPLNKPRGKFAAHKSQTMTIDVEGELFELMKKATSATNTTAFMYLHAVLSIVLCRYNNSDDYAIATPVANRPHKDFDSVVGLFVNTLVLRTHYQSECCFSDYLQQVKSTDVAALDNQETPFEWLVEQLTTQRTTSYNPLVQVLFTYQKALVSDESTFTEHLKPIEFSDQQSKFEFSLRVIEHERKLLLQFDYDTSLFEAVAIQNVVNSVKHVLAQTLTNPEVALGQLQLTTKQSERSQQCGVVNLKGRDTSLLALFYQQVAAHPKAIATRYNEQEFSYEVLAQKVEQLANYLRQQQVGESSRIGLYLDRGPEILVAILASLKINACFVPIDLSNRGERLNSIVNDAKLDMALISQAYWTRWQSQPCQVTDLTLSDWLFHEYSSLPSSSAYQAQTPAYVIYTSGSTGKPKGVEVSHRALLDYCQFALQNYYDVELVGSFLVTSYGFDISLPALLLPLLCGGTVDLSGHHDEVLTELAKRLARPSTQPLLLRLTPMHARALMFIMGDEVCQSQHVFVIGGELFPVSLFAQLTHTFPNATIYNHYGPSEAVVGCCIARLNDFELGQADSLPIGYAMENTQLYVLDKAMQIVPTGVVGELHIGGRCLANGYLNQPELTTQRFVHNPFQPGERLYRTGDLVRQQYDGSLYYVGRIDDQVKLHGFRIELGEVNQQLLMLPQVKAGVTVMAGEEEHRRLVSYVVLNQSNIDPDITLSQILLTLQQNLPSYLCPAQLIDLPELPLSANGKINVKALPEAPMQDSKEFVAANTDLELQLVAIWQQVLRLEQPPSIDCNFFAAGGNSLLVMSLSTALQKQFACVTQMNQLFQYQTIRQQAELIEQLFALQAVDAENDEFEDEGVL